MSGFRSALIASTTRALVRALVLTFERRGKPMRTLITRSSGLFSRTAVVGAVTITTLMAAGCGNGNDLSKHFSPGGEFDAEGARRSIESSGPLNKAIARFAANRAFSEAKKNGDTEVEKLNQFSEAAKVMVANASNSQLAFISIEDDSSKLQKHANINEIVTSQALNRLSDILPETQKTALDFAAEKIFAAFRDNHEKRFKEEKLTPEQILDLGIAAAVAKFPGDKAQFEQDLNQIFDSGVARLVDPIYLTAGGDPTSRFSADKEDVAIKDLSKAWGYPKNHGANLFHYQIIKDKTALSEHGGGYSGLQLVIADQPFTISIE